MMMNTNIQDPFQATAEYRKSYAEQSTLLIQKLNNGSNTGFEISMRPNEFHKYIFRPLIKKEIQTLEGGTCRCRCSNWNQVQIFYTVSYEYRDHHNDHMKDLSSYLLEQYSDTMFSGFVALGVDIEALSSPDQDEPKLPSPLSSLKVGVHRNICIRDCILQPGCRVYGNGILEKTQVFSNASIVNCGTITRTHLKADSSTLFHAMGSMLNICVGPESGGQRLIQVFPESTIVDACHSLLLSKEIKSYTDYESAHSFIQTCPMNILLPQSYILNNPNTITDIFLYENSCIHSSCTVSNATLLPNATISSNSNVSNVCLQWNTTISQSAIVTNTLFMEASSACNAAIVHSSILGPDVHLEGGETHHSLIGPSVNSHHQSLLIGVIWPLGRGNVGYGANVGSNHTGRIPDQECWAGEGFFWGLSCVIKFPVNTLLAPYSIVAAGTTVHPQSIRMPFSLLLDDGTIFPAWVLGHSPYTIARSEKKFVQRRKAKRHLFYTGWKIIRPGMIQMCFLARNLLQSNQSEGIGKCKLTDKARNDGILFYSQFIQRYALHGLLNQLLQRMSDSNPIPKSSKTLLCISIPTTSSGDEPKLLQTNPIMELPWEEASFSNPDFEWKYQHTLLRNEFPNTKSIPQLLKYLLVLERDYTNRVAYSKSKDDYRGNKVIPGYKEAHVLVEDDDVVKMVQLEEKDVCARVEKILQAECNQNCNRSRL